MRKPKGARFWTCADVEARIKANVKMDDDKSTPREAAIWWLAVQYGESLCDSNLRELACLFTDGLKPLRAVDVTQECRNRHEDAASESDTHPDRARDEADNAIEADLREHFGLK